MARDFSDIVKEKSDTELAEMKTHLTSFIPFKQRTILAELQTRAAQSRQDAVVREQAREVTLATLEDWFRGAFSEDLVGQSNEKIIAITLENLVRAGTLKIPRGGYLVTHSKSGINVKPPGKKTPIKAKKPPRKATGKSAKQP